MWLRRRWRAAVFCLSALLIGVRVAWVFVEVPRPGFRDSLVVEYFGWYLANGGTLYLDMWEVKPPLSYALPAAFAAILGDAMRPFHLTNVAITVVLAAAVILLVAHLVSVHTGSRRAAGIGCASLLAIPSYVLRPVNGFKPKYLVLVLGLLAVALVVRRRPRPLAGGVAAATAVGTWQLGAIFPLLVIGEAIRRRRREWIVRACAGVALGLAIVLGFGATVGALGPMLVQTILVPLSTPESASLVHRARLLLTALDIALPLFAIGLLGAAAQARVRRPPDRTWWVPAAAAWFGAALMVDLDGYADVFPIAAICAVGLGLAYADIGSSPAVRRLLRRGVHAILAAGLVASLVFGGNLGMTPGYPIGSGAATVPSEDVEPPYGSAEARTLYWAAEPPGTCRLVIGTTQIRWIQRTDARLVQERCGRMDDVLDDPLERWLEAFVPIDAAPLGRSDRR